jgi:hypothetical protein
MVSEPAVTTNSESLSEDKRVKVVTNKDTEFDGACLDNINKERFEKILSKFKINCSDLFSRALTLREKHKLNIVLRHAKEKQGVRIMDSLIYFEELYIRFPQLLKYLDQENMYLLKVEASEISHQYKMTKNILTEFLEFDN